MKYAAVLYNLLREDAYNYCKHMECELAVDSVGNFLALAITENVAKTIEKDMIDYSNLPPSNKKI